MTSILTESIGRLISHVASGFLHGAAQGDSEEASNEATPSVRFSGFLLDEIRVAIAELEGTVIPGYEKPIQIVVGAAELDGFEGHLLAEDETLTTYRNTNYTGLVIFHVADVSQADEQSLKHVKHVSDSDVFGSASPEVLERRLAFLHQTIWEQISASRKSARPETLETELALLFKRLRTHQRTGLRAWTTFVHNVAEMVWSKERAVTASEVQDILATSLASLRLFPDDALFARNSAIEKRLERNFRASALETPTGTSIDEKDLRKKVAETLLRDPSTGDPLSSAFEEQIKTKMLDVVSAGGPSTDAYLDFAYWEQLFERPSKVSGLGQRIREFLEAEHPERVEEFLGLTVEEGLNDGDPESGEDFLQAENPSDELPLADLLPAQLRRSLDRVTYSREETVGDPLIAVLYGLKGLPDDAIEPVEVTLSWEQKGQASLNSAQLFGFLYGQTLNGVSQNSLDGAGNEFHVDPVLVDSSKLDEVIGHLTVSDEGDNEADEEPWDSLRLTLRSSSSRTPLARFRWDPREIPGLVLFAQLIARGGVGGSVATPDLDEWATRALSAVENLTPVHELPANGLTAKWAEFASVHIRNIAESGMSADALGKYVLEWAPLLRRARNELIPQNSPLEDLSRFTEFETAHTRDGSIVVLGTHPLRLRWLGHHLSGLAAYLSQALDGELKLNSENDQLFVEKLKQLSPHGDPPMLTASGRLYTATRELGFHEEYSEVQVSSDSVSDGPSGLDDASIDEMVRTLQGFVGAFPHKTAGLTVLLVTPTGAAPIARRLIARFLKRPFADVQVELHVVTQAEEHADVAEFMSEFDSELGRDRLLMPPFRLVLHAWRDDPCSVVDQLAGRVDIAIAPNLFGLNTEPIEEFQDRETGIGGAYDPWRDRPTHQRAVMTGSENVSRVLLPDAPDEILEDWSTISVRNARNQALNSSDPSGTELYTLQVRFHENERLFKALHEAANWVVTLDPFVGREQIDAINEAPDILTVKPSVGKNQMYTLVVSSKAGREWVVRRLARRLVDDLEIEPTTAEYVALRLYDIGRQVVPGLMLRAIGPGQFIKEIIGLVLARVVLDEEDDRDFNGFEYWVSLDEWAKWFGGEQRIRPDLLRIRLSTDEEHTELDLLVIESKFRQDFDLGKAETQVSRAMTLFGEAFDKEHEPSDASFWRRELVAAIEQLPRTQTSREDLPPFREVGNPKRSEKDVRSDIREGNYEFNGVKGLVSLTSWSSTDSGDSNETRGGLPLQVIDEAQARRIIQLLASSQSRNEPERPDGRLAGFKQHQPDSTGPIDLATKVEDPAPQTAPEQASDDASAKSRDEATRDAKIRQAALASPVSDQHAEPAPGTTASPRLGPAELEGRLQLILDRLYQLGAPCERPEGEACLEGPGFCSFRVVPKSGLSAKKVTGKVEDLKLALELPAESSIRSFVDRGAVVFEVPKADEDRYFVNAGDLLSRVQGDPESLAVPFAEDADGEPVEINFSSSDTPHLLIAGATGAGKSVALETILHGLCELKSPDQLQLHLVDGKGTELVDFEDKPHVAGSIGSWPEDAIQVLEGAVAEMTDRYQNKFRPQRTKNLVDYNKVVDADQRLPWWLVVLDEYADLTSDSDERRQIEDALKRIAQKGRAAGIHLIVSTQKPTAEVLSTVIRSNLPSQLALRVRDASDSRIILDEAGAESLAGKGEAFLKTAKGMIRVQCAMA